MSLELRKINRHQENNDVVQHVVNYIIFQQNKKLSVEDESHENINSKVDENYLYEIDDMSLDEKK